MMRVLVLGDAENIWVKRFVKNVLIEMRCDVYLQDYYPKEQDADYYGGAVISSYKTVLEIPGLLKRIPKLNSFLNITRTAFVGRFGQGFDVIHIHFIDPYSILLALSLKKKGTKIIASFWGSDLLRANSQTLELLKRLLGRLDVITIQPTQTMIDGFFSAFGDAFRSKLRYRSFLGGGSCFDALDGRESKARSKCVFGIKETDCVISIGYNASSAQNHLEVIEAIKGVPRVDLESVVFMFQMSYPQGANDYVVQVKRAMEELPCSSIFVEGRLDDADVAHLRLASDIFIHAQSTDAASASVEEFMRAEALVLSPEWINYQELKNIGVVFVEYRFFSDITIALTNILEGKMNIDCTGNKRLLVEKNKGEGEVRKWMETYQDMQTGVDDNEI